MDERNSEIVVQMVENFSQMTYGKGLIIDDIQEISRLNKKFMNYFYSDSTKILTDYNLVRNELINSKPYKLSQKLSNMVAFSNRVLNCIKNIHEVTVFNINPLVVYNQ